MCGIAGIVSLNAPVERERIDRLTDALVHRGPDGRGTWLSDDFRVALGHRRLSILDVSDAGKQPMEDAEGRFVITYNGEIYNYIEIREELKTLGYVFRTGTDTEVILAAYRAWGSEMLVKFNGMWAFSVYDTLKRELFLSRDRFGVKPLYYYFDGRELIFASEVKAIHTASGIRHVLDKAVLKSIAAGSFTHHGTVKTYLKNVLSLPAGHSLIWREGKVSIKQEYCLQKREIPEDLHGQALTLKNLLYDACKIRLRSDVKVATCLSGGVDSGSIVSVVEDISTKFSSVSNTYTHQGFCVSFPGMSSDESEAASALAREKRIELDIIPVEAPNPDELEFAMQRCDGPMHSLAFYPIARLYEHIKKAGVTVTLDGQGPDEMLGGYNPVRAALNASLDRRDLKWLIDVYRTYAAQGEAIYFSSKEFALKNLVAVFTLDFAKRLAGKRYMSSKYKLPSEFQNADSLERSLFEQFFFTPLPGILHQYDRCSMAGSVECRMPFMDYRVVEFIFSLPSTSKVGGGFTKRVLREAVKEVLPDYIRLNKKKLGFNAPLVDWFQGPLRQWMLYEMSRKEFLNSSFFDGKRIRSDFMVFMNSSKPRWKDAWKFWPPVHVMWWIRNYT